MIARSKTSFLVMFLAMLAGVCLVPLLALADKVVLKTGNTFEGQILEETNKQVVLKMQYGTMTFKKADIKQVIKGKYAPKKPPSTSRPETTEPPPAPPVKGSLQPVRNYIVEAEKAVKVRNFIGALVALKKGREVAQTDAPAAVPLIDAKIRKVTEQALIVIEINIDKVFVPEAMHDPALRRDRKAEPVSDASARKEATSALRNTLERTLKQRGFIVIDGLEAKKKPVQKLRATYSDSGGTAYRGHDAGIIGYRIHATCKLEMLSASGGSGWSETVEAATPNYIARGSTREGALRALEGKMSLLSFGIR